MKKKQLILGMFSVLIIVVLAACGESQEDGSSTAQNNEVNDDSQTENAASSNEDSHSSMDPSSSGKIPDGLTDAENPQYPSDSEAVINTNHMEGMDGAVATIDGAYDTTVYTVTYTPTTGGDEVEDHKWVIHEEIENAQDKPYEKGDEVVLNATHMEGMDEAAATIDSAENTTVYMVSYIDTETEEKVSNHKWVTEEELSEKE